MRLSVLDLGSNSFHVLVADVDEDGSVVPVAREREMLHLGAVVAEHGHVPDAERRRAVEVVVHLTELAGRMGAHRRLAVATSALREASNGPEVVAEMAAATETPVRVIDGDEEAGLAYRGVRASVATDDEPLLVLDLGGGSLELVVGDRDTVTWSASLDLGVSRLSARAPRDPPKKSEMRALRDVVREAVRPLRDTVADLAPAGVVAVGGTSAGTRGRGRDRGFPLNQYAIPTGEVAGLRDRLAGMDTDERAGLPGMKARRADRAHIAATILATTLESLDLDGFLVSDWGLREGVLLDAVDAPAAPTSAALRRREVERVHAAFTAADAPTAHVADLAVALFDGTRPLHGMDVADRELLWCGATLHDIGESLALRRHHQHGAYLLEHAEMRGFSPVETAIMCSLARFHNSRGLSTDFPPFASLRKKDRRRAEGMVALLQMADGLDRARDQSVRGLDVELDGAAVRIVLRGAGLHVARAEVDRKTPLFERTFDADVQVHEEANA